MLLRLRTGNVYTRTAAAATKYVVNQGGSGSSKTYSILQHLLVCAVTDRLHISICSLAMPHLKKGALHDWLNILDEAEVYNEAAHNKTENIFQINNSTVEFFSLDSPGKARGPRRDVLFINEANLVSYQIFQQLILRTKQKVFLDYNPADEFHWIYDQVLPRPDCTFIQSNYLDNPFLTAGERHEIERLQHIDENLWQVYGLGNRGTARATIYTHWDTVESLPEGGETIYGLDFGFNNPTALIRLQVKDGEIYAEQLIYKSSLTNSDLIGELAALIPDKAKPIYADAAEPQRIEEIRRAGYNIYPADKSVKDGIDRIRRTPLHVVNTSVDLLKEIKSYKYMEDKDGKVLEEPVKMHDHLCDGLRYAFHTYSLVPKGKYYFI